MVNLTLRHYLVYVLGVGLIVMQLILGYYDVFVWNTPEDLLTRALFIGLGAFIMLRERSTMREFNDNKLSFELQNRIDEELEPAVKFVLLNRSLFAQDETDRDWMVSTAADYFDVEQERLEQELARISADIEIASKTGELPPEN